MQKSVKEISLIIKDYLKDESDYRRINFEKYEDKYGISYVSDELNGKFLLGFGGNYESSITFRYALNLGLEVEVYLSNNKALRIGNSLLPILNSVNSGLNAQISTTRYIPNESSLTFTLNYPISKIDDYFLSLVTLGTMVSVIAERLAKY